MPGLTLEKMKHDRSSQGVELLSGTPIVARRNNTPIGIANNQSFTIKKIDMPTKIVADKHGDLIVDIAFTDFKCLFL